MNVNVWDVNAAGAGADPLAAAVDLRALADPGTSLESLVPLTTDAQRSA